MAKKLLTNRAFLVAALTICCIALLSLFTIGGLQFHQIQKGSAAGIRYDSREHTPIYERIVTGSGASTSFSASMVFQPNSTVGYLDLFQTAPLNTGIRLELSGKVLALIVGARNATGYVPYIITDSLDTTQPHLLELHIDNANRVSISVDRQEVVTSVTPELDYAISDIAVGTGLSKMRPFSGRITDFSYAYAYYEKSNVSGYLAFARIILGTLILVFLGFLLRVTRFNLAQLLPDIGGAEEDDDVTKIASH